MKRIISMLPLCLGVLLLAGCKSARKPVGADKANTERTYRQTHDNSVGQDTMSRETRELLHRYGQDEQFEQSPDETLRIMHDKAVATRTRGMLFALSELNYLAANRLRHGVKPWEPLDARDYYLASAVYAWLFLFGDAAESSPDAFDLRFRTACDLYNFGLGWALTERRGTNAVAILASGERRLPLGRIELKLTQPGFPWPLEKFDQFLVSDQFLVHGLSVHNR